MTRQVCNNATLAYGSVSAIPGYDNLDSEQQKFVEEVFAACLDGTELPGAPQEKGTKKGPKKTIAKKAKKATVEKPKKAQKVTAEKPKKAKNKAADKAKASREAKKAKAAEEQAADEAKEKENQENKKNSRAARAAARG
jgi:hypothetical protein